MHQLNYNEIALICRVPSPAHMQMSMCAYLIRMCGIRRHVIASKMAEKVLLMHIALQEAALTKQILV